jgi:hypothetical protein
VEGKIEKERYMKSNAKPKQFFIMHQACGSKVLKKISKDRSKDKK